MNQNKSEMNNKKVSIEIWRSFLLNPDFPKDTALATIPYLSEHKGYPLSQVQAMCEQLSEQGKIYDIDFQFDKALAFNTIDSHRLIHWAKSHGRSNELKEAFMIAYFSKGMDLSKDENLLSVVVELGLDKLKAQAVLSSDEYLTDVQEDIRMAQRIGIRGVPFFVFNQKSPVSGAQADVVFVQAVTAALKDLEIEQIEGKVCEPGKVCD